MYRILLADDEGLELESLKYFIEKNFGKECELRMVRSGRAAIEMTNSFQPDIAIMDIQMPGINGINAMKEMRRTHPDMFLIVLTAYDVFDYAKESISLGVLQYLTKPLKKNQLLSALYQAMDQIDRTRKKRQDDILLREKLDIALPMLEQGFIYSLVLKQENQMSVHRYRELLGITETSGFFLILKGQIPEKRQELLLWNQTWNESYERIAANVKRAFHAIVSPSMGDEIAALVLCGEQSEEEQKKEMDHVLSKARVLVRRFEEETGLGIRIGVGSVTGISRLRLSYEQARDSLQSGQEPVCSYLDMPHAWANAARFDQHVDHVAEARAIIESRYASELSLSLVADEIHVSSFYLTRLFKEKTGVTFLEYLTKIRMEAAQDMLLHTEKSIKEIAASAGYQDPNYFSRSFKKYTGLSPREFREGIGGEKA